MAIVANTGNPFEPIDKSYQSPNRSMAGTPVAALTPQYAGEIVLDTTNNKLWKAEALPGTAMTNASWVSLTTELQM